MAGPVMSGERRGAGGAGYRPVADINVTPLVDVMLVLLIVFMVTALLLTVAVPCRLCARKRVQSVRTARNPCGEHRRQRQRLSSAKLA